MQTFYQQVLAEIFAHVDYHRSRQVPYNASTYNLDRMRELCRLLGNPQDDFPSLHIAGSKGKGSTAAMASAILQQAGYQSGLYTSPHLHSFRERMRIDSALITQEQLTELWLEARPVVKSLEQVTTFEIITALAFIYFSRKSIDWAVLEVGLGGRLDATNIVQSQACAITSLSHEHTDLLGHTLSLIAFEKAGIIKSNGPVVVGPQAPEAMLVIEDVAAETGALLWRVDEKGTQADWTWHIQEASQDGILMDIEGPDLLIDAIYLPMVGYHQAANATVAVALIHSLREKGVNIPDEIVRKGLAQTYWPGRLECLSKNPVFLVDSAHNRHSAERLEASLALFPTHRRILLFGASADKDIGGMLEVLAKQSAAVIVTRSFHPRASDPEELAALARQIAPDIPVFIQDDALPALELAKDLAEPGDLILGTGSIFVVAALRESWLRLHPEMFPQDDWAHFSEPIDGQFTAMLNAPDSESLTIPLS